jgi:hypothetical protein
MYTRARPGLGITLSRDGDCGGIVMLVLHAITGEFSVTDGDGAREVPTWFPRMLLSRPV